MKTLNLKKVLGIVGMIIAIAGNSIASEMKPSVRLQVIYSPEAMKTISKESQIEARIEIDSNDTFTKERAEMYASISGKEVKNIPVNLYMDLFKATVNDDFVSICFNYVGYKNLFGMIGEEPTKKLRCLFSNSPYTLELALKMVLNVTVDKKEYKIFFNRIRGSDLLISDGKAHLGKEELPLSYPTHFTDEPCLEIQDIKPATPKTSMINNSESGNSQQSGVPE